MNEIILTEEGKYNFFQSLFRSLVLLSDKEKQRRAWVEESDMNYIDFDEVYMLFMSPCNCILTWHDLSKAQHDMLEKLYKMVEDYDSRYKTDEEICNDPEWDGIREFTKKVYEKLKHVRYISGIS